MREPRWIQNARAKETAKREMWEAWEAVENFRRNKDCSGFLAVRIYFDDFLHRPCPSDQVFKISGFGVLNELVTREEYDRMRAAWFQTEAGRSYRYKYDHEWETPTAQLPVPNQDSDPKSVFEPVD